MEITADYADYADYADFAEEEELGLAGHLLQKLTDWVIARIHHFRVVRVIRGFYRRI